MPRGRPTKLTPEFQKAICDSIALTKVTLADCARSLGIDDSTVFRWLEKGKKARAGPYRDFYDAVTKARADGTKMLLARIATAGREPKHWQANVALLAMTEPAYAPQVRVRVTEELTNAVKRLEEEFANEPDILDRAYAALIGGHRGGEASGPGPGPARPNDSGSQTVQPPQAEPEAGGVPPA